MAAVEVEAEPEATRVATVAVEAVAVEVELWVQSILKLWKDPASFTISMARRHGHVLTDTSAR